MTGKRYLTNYNTRISHMIMFLLLNEHIIIEAFYYVTITPSMFKPSKVLGFIDKIKRKLKFT